MALQSVSLKNKEIITTPNHFETWTIQTEQYPEDDLVNKSKIWLFKAFRIILSWSFWILKYIKMYIFGLFFILYFPSYVWKIMKTKKETLTLVWEIITTASPYTNITKRCSLCLPVKLAIFMYPNQSKFLNKRLEQISKCRHQNKFLL